jgi:hypothetical protein
MQSGLKLLDINVEEFDRRLRAAKAVKWPDKKMRRHIYVTDEANFFKLRDEGDQVVLDVFTNGQRQTTRIDAGFEKASVLLHDLGHEPTAYHELVKSFYLVGNIMVDVVKWPKIPPYAEFTGPERKVKRLINKLGFNPSNAAKVSTQELFRLYGIKIENQKHLKF